VNNKNKLLESKMKSGKRGGAILSQCQKKRGMNMSDVSEDVCPFSRPYILGHRLCIFYAKYPNHPCFYMDVPGACDCFKVYRKCSIYRRMMDK
jgi:hypothetical protein